MDNEDDFAKDTKLCAAMLTGPQDAEDGSEVCILPSGEEVNFYQVIPSTGMNWNINWPMTRMPCWTK